MGTATTQEIVQQMMGTPTGSAMCDSGGTPQYDTAGNYTGSTSGYGRNWERNQGKDFEATQEASLNFSYKEIEFTRSVYHFMCNTMDYDSPMDSLYQSFLKEEAILFEQGLPFSNGTPADDSSSRFYPQDIYAFADWLVAEGFKINSGIYGDGSDGEVGSVNSYNGECNISQTLQIHYFYLEDIPEKYEDTDICEGIYLFVQLHQGADVRGGYTSPVAFTPNENYSEIAWLMFSDGSIHCDACDTYWSTDDSWNWYENGATGDVVLNNTKQAAATTAWKESRQISDERVEHLKAKWGEQSIWRRALRNIYKTRDNEHSYKWEWFLKGGWDKQFAIDSAMSSIPTMTASHYPSCIAAKEKATALDEAVPRRKSINLRDLDVIELDDLEVSEDFRLEVIPDEQPPLPSMPEATTILHSTDRVVVWGLQQAKDEGKYIILVDENGSGHCPLCGGHLSAAII